MTYCSAYLSVLHLSTYLFSAACKSIARSFQSFNNQQVIYNKIYQSHYRLIECFILQTEVIHKNQRVHNHNRRDYYNYPCVFYNKRWAFLQNWLVSDENRRVFTNNHLAFNYNPQVSDTNQWVIYQNRWVININLWVAIKESQLNTILSFKTKALILYSIIQYLTGRL